MPLKIGIVGMNNIAQPHAAAYAADELGELVAICDRVPERADAGAEKYGARPYYSLADMLDGEPDLDIVDVCTGGYENGSWHFEPAMQAMDAGKHVLVEKPLSSDVGEARQMVAKAAERGVYLGCNLNHYFSPPAERARQHLDDGDVGELVYCLCKMGFNGSEPESYNAPGGMVKGFPYFHLKAFLSHPLSVMRYLCGDVTHVQAFLERPGFRRRAGDVMLTTASVHLRFANGAVGYLLSQRGDCTYGLGGWWSVEVAGTKGTFCIENCIEKLTWWKAPQPNAGAAGEVYESGTADFGLTFNHRIHAWLEDISNGVPLEQVRGSGRDALAALEITWAAMESYEQGGILVRP
ncbi:MAG: Gfo/Idh/MocA family oxidoreductase, partial [Armatimonadetes bacterium]|nr:Gfo/Idh/MocA family oxidoreductase [Armatimonadota bacterium]